MRKIACFVVLATALATTAWASFGCYPTATANVSQDNGWADCNGNVTCNEVSGFGCQVIGVANIWKRDGNGVLQWIATQQTSVIGLACDSSAPCNLDIAVFATWGHGNYKIDYFVHDYVTADVIAEAEYSGNF